MNHVDGAEGGQGSEVEIAACLLELFRFHDSTTVIVLSEVFAFVGVQDHLCVGGRNDDLALPSS